MSGEAAGGGGGVAPAAAPSAPSGGGAPSGAGTSAPNGNAPSTNGQQAGGTPAAPTRAPMLIKHKATIGEGESAREHEIELDIAEHLAAQRFKFKADGEDVDLSFDEVQQRLPMSQAAWKRMSKAAEETKRAEGVIKENADWRGKVENTLRDPVRGLALFERALGGREQALRAMEQYVAAHVAEQKLTPEQRQMRADEQRRRGEMEQNGQKLSEREKLLQQREEAVNAAEAKRLESEYRQAWPKALEAAGVKETPHTVRLMGQFKYAAYQQGITLSDADAAREVASEVRRLLGGLDGQTLASAVPDAAQQLQRSQIEQLNATQPGRVAQRSAAQSAPRPALEAKPEETWEEMHERITKRSDELFHKGRPVRG